MYKLGVVILFYTSTPIIFYVFFLSLLVQCQKKKKAVLTKGKQKHKTFRKIILLKWKQKRSFYITSKKKIYTFV